ncbi:unnamed protein product [Peronospora belbahrii]|uniref:Uncharacterized protein n=1 Tax=Peronospora belbahrii TaxID=622444 RepID=A0ABN8CRN5_9STRA|nr:unnamed protein product [Peronospora belbahrii]
MLIENDQVRVRASNEMAAMQEKMKHEIAHAQSQLVTVRAQLRLQDRGPDMERADSIMNELMVCKAQLERQKKAEMEQTKLLTNRYWSECRIATVDAKRVLNAVVGMFQTKLRLLGRMSRDGAMKRELEVTCDGVQRLTFMKLFNVVHDFSLYMSTASLARSLEQDQFVDLFGNSLCHEERAGFFYVAIAPMVVVFDSSTEIAVMKCEWTEQNALRDSARNFRLLRAVECSSGQ